MFKPNKRPCVAAVPPGAPDYGYSGLAMGPDPPTPQRLVAAAPVQDWGDHRHFQENSGDFITTNAMSIIPRELNLLLWYVIMFKVYA